ncbi:hypothetical protein JYT15_00675, partial [Acidimicrobium ferrooxidans]|nr:hypothetical protein [Acidimicrobium ferrooxidans]
SMIDRLLAERGLTPLSVYLATEAVSELLTRTSEAGYLKAGQAFQLSADQGKLFIEPNTANLEHTTVITEIEAMADCERTTAEALAQWIIQVAAYKPSLIAGFSATPIGERVALEPIAERETDLFKRWRSLPTIPTPAETSESPSWRHHVLDVQDVLMDKTFDPDPDQLFELACEYEKRLELERAEDVLVNASRLDPNPIFAKKLGDVRINLLQARVFDLRRKKLRGAPVPRRELGFAANNLTYFKIDEFSRRVLLDEQDAESQLGLGMSLCDVSRYDEAERPFFILKQMDLDENTKKCVSYHLAFVFEKQDKVREAFQEFSSLMNIDAGFRDVTERVQVLEVKLGAEG